jgi:hypothetical protein
VKWLTNLFSPARCSRASNDPPRCETAEEPYLAGYEDRAEGRPASIHPSVYMTECQCIRCSEYMLGWRDADCDRITRLRRVAEKKHGWARGHAPIHREPEPTPAPPEPKRSNKEGNKTC